MIKTKADHGINVMSRKVQEDSLQSELYPHIVTSAETDIATRSLFFEATAERLSGGSFICAITRHAMCVIGRDYSSEKLFGITCNHKNTCALLNCKSFACFFVQFMKSHSSSLRLWAQHLEIRFDIFVNVYNFVHC